MRNETTASASFRVTVLAALLGASAAILVGAPARAQQSCSCEGAMGPQIQPSTLVVGNSVTIDLCYTNTAKVAGGIANNVEVDLTGNVYARLACSDAGCLTEGDGGNSALELPDTLTFDDCVASPLSPGAFADVASCELDLTNHPDGNTVLIQLDGDGLHFTDNQVLCIARIQATANEAVPTVSGSFLTRVATDPDGIVIAEPAADPDGVACSNNGNVCGTNGTSSASIPPRCIVELDKQVRCGATGDFVDVGFGDSVAESCNGWNEFDGMSAEPVHVRYVARNSPDSDLPVANCELTESNGLIGDPTDPGLIALGETFELLDTDQVCSDELAANEPNTATIDCECIVQDGTIPASDTDMADFACLEPRLQVEKQCEDTDADGAHDRVSIEVMNIAGENTANLVSCVLTDSLDTNEPSATCPGDGVDLENVPVTPSSFDLAAGGSQSASGTFGNRLAPSCNTASVTCEIEGAGGKTVTAEDSFPCEPLTCDVRLDKVLIVDGERIDENDFDVRVLGQGISWAGFDGMPPDDVDFEFIIENNGTADAECELIDVVEGGTERVNETVVVAAGETEVVTRQSACTADIAGTDTATISCTCIDDAQETVTDTDTDSAELLCLAPGLAVAKECVDTDPQNGLDDGVSITVMNTGEADLVNCQVTDSLDRNEPGGVCPGDDVDVTSVTVAPQGFSLAAGTPGNPTEQVVTGTFGDLVADACNEVSVTCTVNGTDKTITAMNDAACTGGECRASFDKQVSCDGVTFVDIEASDDPGNEVVRGCVGWNAFDGMPAEPASRRFVVENTGDFPIECSIVDVNGGSQNFGPFTVQPDATETIDDPGTCSPEISGTDTATLSCSCVGTEVEITEDTPFVDQAEILCRTPRLEVSKLCEPKENERNEITIMITNPAGADGAVLENCVVSDPQAPECDGAPVSSPLAPGASDTVTCGIDGLASEITNSVTVTCDVQGTSKEISETATDLCEVPGGCLTRTPGFWCTHPTVTDMFLNVDVCGLTLDNVQVATVGSAIENMNFGNDHKASTSPQLLQLVRQCTAAALNQAASLENEGNCGGVPVNSSTFDAVFDQCCSASFCAAGTSGSAISASGCIEQLDAFNNSEDTFENAPAPFDNLGTATCPVPDGSQPTLTNACSAQPARCQAAGGNGFVNPPYENPNPPSPPGGGPKPKPNNAKGK